MADPTPRATQQLLSADEIAERVEALAASIAPRLDEQTIGVCLLTGGIWFAADLTRALYRAGKDLAFDALWLGSYGDATHSQGLVEVRAGLQRPVKGRTVLIIDDVFDTGLSLQAAVDIVRAAGARLVLTAVFARKPWPKPRRLEPDFVAWEAPARFLVGYGLDEAGRRRGFPGIAALD